MSLRRRLADWDPVEAEKQSMIGQKIGEPFQGYGADMAREQKNWDAQHQADLRECGGGGHDEIHEEDEEAAEVRARQEWARSNRRYGRSSRNDDAYCDCY